MLKIYGIDWQSYSSPCDTLFSGHHWILPRMYDPSLCDTPDELVVEKYTVWSML